MNDAPALEVRNLGKRFPTRQGRDPSPWVIRDLSFSVAAGEFVTVIGPSGSGKSTLLNLIAQIDVATAGEILFAGEIVVSGASLNLRPGLDRRIGYVTQDDNLLPWRTTLENVLFPLEVQGRLSDETRRNATLLFDAVGLAGYERYYPHELSGGMRKRASLIRTLVYDPPVILMDEPFAAVDAQRPGSSSRRICCACGA
jgi:NitT/TauT family transport system ATP-binding protein